MVTPFSLKKPPAILAAPSLQDFENSSRVTIYELGRSNLFTRQPNTVTCMQQLTAKQEHSKERRPIEPLHDRDYLYGHSRYTAVSVCLGILYAGTRTTPGAIIVDLLGSVSSALPICKVVFERTHAMYSTRARARYMQFSYSPLGSCAGVSASVCIDVGVYFNRSTRGGW